MDELLKKQAQGTLSNQERIELMGLGYQKDAEAPILPQMGKVTSGLKEGFSELKKRFQPEQPMPKEMPDYSEPAMDKFRAMQANLPGQRPERINPEVQDEMELLNTLSEFDQLDPEQEARKKKLMNNKIVKEFLDKKGR